MKEEWGGFLNRDFIQGIAVSTLSFLSVVLIPLAGAIVIVLTPLPVLFYYTKLGRFRGGAVFAVSLTLVLLILKLINPDIIFPLLLLTFAGGTGIMLAEVLRKPWPVERTLIIPVAVLLTCGGCLLLLQSYQTGQPPLRLMESYILSSIAENIKIYEQTDISSEQLTFIKDQAGPIAALLTRIFPAMFLVGAGLFIWLNIFAARRLFQKYGLPYPEFGDLTRWKAPDKMVWLLIGAGGMLLVEAGAVKYTGINLLIICLFVYLCAGFSVIGYFFKVKRIPLFFKVLFYVLIIIQQYLLLLVMALGLFDLWADFRKLIKPAQDSGV
ncbi:MAG: hypothetical protein CVU74_00575 [Deltaproteobacteria bacterium HGW-Deltaproteobacteria-9]|nr:MAG: hypothetical protein CVU74_00575 [Deltaproteobacteria bacterium HGW-Deltaproteobacteria-9]